MRDFAVRQRNVNLAIAPLSGRGNHQNTFVIARPQAVAIHGCGPKEHGLPRYARNDVSE